MLGGLVLGFLEGFFVGVFIGFFPWGFVCLFVLGGVWLLWLFSPEKQEIKINYTFCL